MYNFPSEGSCNLFRGSRRVPALLRVQSGAVALGSVCPEALEDMSNLNSDRTLRTYPETLHWDRIRITPRKLLALALEREWEVIKLKFIKVKFRLATGKRYTRYKSAFTVHVYCTGSDSKTKVSHKKQTKISDLKKYILHFYSPNQEKEWTEIIGSSAKWIQEYTAILSVSYPLDIEK